ncbi:MAG TPA: HEAT repeat domain-containing protein, partial [Abditibacteriaceae bacterium]
MSKAYTRQWMAGAISMTLTCSAIAAENPTPGASQRRQAVLTATKKGVAGLPVLKAAMADSNPIVRRAAVRGLSQIGSAAVDTLAMVAQQDKDALIRRSALRALVRN